MLFLINKSQKYSLILCPPPNLTGSLHTGHILNLTLIDFHTRYNYYFQDQSVVSVIGYDHAGLSAEIVAKQNLALDSDETIILDQIQNNVRKFKQKIREQIGKYNFAIIDTDLVTIDQQCIEIVHSVLEKLEKMCLITYSLQLYFHDIINRTIVSDLDVESINQTKKLYTVKYFLENSNNYLEVSTTQPETIESDVCLVINPIDNRYLQYLNHNVINPLNNQKLQILAHKNVDINYGTGVLKITPLYDRKDLEILKDLKLKYQNTLPYDTKNFCMNSNSIFNGKKLDEVKALTIEILEKKGLISKIENVYGKTYQVSRSGNQAITLMSWQYCIDLLQLTKISKYCYDNLNIIGSNGKNEISKFIRNLKDWTITRQNCYGIGYKQNKLDTWVSSSLYIAMILKKLSIQRENVSIIIYTGYDIVFYWIYKMYYMQQIYDQNKPIDVVTVHGLICDSKGNKMSKSKGNVIDIDFTTNIECENYKSGIICLNVFDKRITYDQNKIDTPKKTITKIQNIIRLLQMKFRFNEYKYSNSLENITNSLIYKIIINYIIQLIDQDIIKSIEKINDFHYFVKAYFGNVFIESFKVNIEKDKNYQYYNQIAFSSLLVILKYIMCFMPIQAEKLWQEISQDKLEDINTCYSTMHKQYCKDIQNVIEILKLQNDKKIYSLTVRSESDIDVNYIFYQNNNGTGEKIFECKDYYIIYNKQLDKEISQVQKILDQYL